MVHLRSRLGRRRRRSVAIDSREMVLLWWSWQRVLSWRMGICRDGR